MDKTKPIKVYGTTWCIDTKRARDYLDKNQISYEWIDIDKDEEAANFVKTVNKGFRSVPTIIFADGTMLVEPSVTELGMKLSSE